MEAPRPVRSYGGVSAPERIAVRRAALVEAGLELFGTRGFAATGVRDVCTQAGLTTRYFYESFTDGGELFVAVFDRLAGELFELVMAAVGAAERDPESQLRAAIETYVRTLAADPRKGRVLFVEPVAAGPRAHEHARLHMRQMAAAVTSVGRAHLPAGLPAHALEMGGLSVVGAIERVLVEWHQGDVEATEDQVTEFLVGLFLLVGAGFGVNPPPGR
ncbi:MAG TPA: TetR/AcrR family transcriptional regulator [Solirubrobacteraceae bacterium]